VGPVLALASACSFGMSDFTGGLAARRASALVVTLGAQVAGLLVLAPALVLLGASPRCRALGVGGLAGLLGAGGLLLYLRCMALGPDGGGLPAGRAGGRGRAGRLGCAHPGEALRAAEVDRDPARARRRRLRRLRPWAGAADRPRGPLLALAAGAAFGGFFVALDATPVDSGLWPLLGARVLGIALLGSLLASPGARGPTPAPRG
jgi:hypothetical protein